MSKKGQGECPLCGLAGFSLHPDEQVNSRFLAANLLLNIDHRGGDASGAAWRTKRGTVSIQKAAVRAWKLLSDFQLSQHARTAILHTRFTTQGSEKNNINNHPVATSGLVGVHNGSLWNDADLFDRMPNVRRHGQVDTEAIFAAIANYSELGLSSPIDALEVIEGSAAIAWMTLDRNDPWLYAARISGSPFHWAQTEVGSFIFASEHEALVQAIEQAGMKVEKADSLLEGTFLTVKHGTIHGCEFFEPAWSRPTTTPARSYTGGTVTGWGTHTVPRRVEEPKGTDPLTVGLDDFNPFFQLAEAEAPTNARRDAIERWEEQNHPASDPELCLTMAQWWDAMFQYHGFAKVGQTVYTDLCGQYARGQIAHVPNTFPEGEFILRLVVPSSREGGEEVVYVTRQYDEFAIPTREVEGSPLAFPLEEEDALADAF